MAAKQDGQWTSDMVKELRDLYKAKSVCVVEGVQLSDDALNGEGSFRTASELNESPQHVGESSAPKGTGTLPLLDVDPKVPKFVS